jgi:hypothetical protein
LSRDLQEYAALLAVTPVWSTPAPVSAVAAEPAAAARAFASPQLVADDDGRLHAFWTEGAAGTVPGQLGYAVWQNGAWSRPQSLFAASGPKLAQPAAVLTREGRLVLLWSGGNAGEIFFSWAAAARAMVASEWTEPAPLPAPVSAGSAPAIAVDPSSGALYAAYAIPLNEARGIYLTSSAAAKAGPTQRSSLTPPPPAGRASTSPGWPWPAPASCTSSSGSAACPTTPPPPSCTSPARATAAPPGASRRRSTTARPTAASSSGATWPSPAAASSMSPGRNGIRHRRAHALAPPFRGRRADLEPRRAHRRLWPGDGPGRPAAGPGRAPLYCWRWPARPARPRRGDEPQLAQWQWSDEGQRWEQAESLPLRAPAPTPNQALAATITGDGDLVALLVSESESGAPQLVSAARAVALPSVLPTPLPTLTPTPPALRLAQPTALPQPTPTLVFSTGAGSSSGPLSFLPSLGGNALITGAILALIPAALLVLLAVVVFGRVRAGGGDSEPAVHLKRSQINSHHASRTTE